jgi:hypothetical protein
MAITGLGLAFEEVPILKTMHKWISNVHAFTQGGLTFRRF